MAYTTGVSASVSELITAVKAFAVANSGFTDPGGSWTSGSYTLTQLLKDGIYYTFQYKSDELLMNTATVAGSTGLASALTGACSSNARTWPIAGPHVGYHLFNGGGAGDCVHVVVEIVAGVFVHFSFGVISKLGSYTGGEYVTGCQQYSNWDINLQSDADGDVNSNWNHPPWAGKYAPNVSNSTTTRGHIRFPGSGYSFGVWGYYGGLHAVTIGACFDDNNSWGLFDGYHQLDCAINAFNLRAPLVPIDIYIASTVSNDPPSWLSLGHVSGACAVSTAYLAPKQIVLTDWMVFPIFERDGSRAVYPNSKFYGIAYKK